MNDCNGRWSKIMGSNPKTAVFADWSCACGARHPQECKVHPAMPPPAPFPQCLAKGFGDPLTLLNSRDWLQKAIEAMGAKVTGAGIGCGQADMDFTLEGFEFNVSLKPIIRDRPRDAAANPIEKEKP
jgi:hypothetical protein